MVARPRRSVLYMPGSNAKAIAKARSLTKVVYFDSVQDEINLYGMKADILAEKEGKLLIIEVYYRHKVEDQKIEKIRNANISAIEINLSELMPEDVRDTETFWSYINDPMHIQWLHNAKAYESIYPELVSRLEVKVQRVEKEYDALHRQVKEELAKDLKIVKMLCGKQHRAKSFKELKKQHIWQTHGEGSNLSLENLPGLLQFRCY